MTFFGLTEKETTSFLSAFENQQMKQNNNNKNAKIVANCPLEMVLITPIIIVISYTIRYHYMLDHYY